VKACVSRVDITPPVGFPIGGNVRADNLARGTHDPLFCTVLLLSDGVRRACLLGFDLLGLHLSSCRLIRRTVAGRAGLDAAEVLVSATHTHSGPDVLDFFKAGVDPRSLVYLEGVAERVADEVSRMQGCLEEATFEVARTDVTDLSFNRRIPVRGGQVKMNWEHPVAHEVAGPAGPTDPELLVLVLRGADGCVRALLVDFALHPAILVGERWLWSRDFVHFLERRLRKEPGLDVPVFFANGAEGNVNHLDYRNPDRTTGFEEAERVGTRLAEHVLRALRAPEPLAPLHLDVRFSTIRLPRRRIGPEELSAAEELLRQSAGVPLSLVDGVPDEVFAAQVVALARIPEPTVETDLQVVSLSPAFALATLPGEAFVEFGLSIKARSPFQRTLVVGLSDDCIGYIPTPRAFQEGGYETRTASSSQLAPEAGPMLEDAVVALLGG
jgi:neutral ceramidase